MTTLAIKQLTNISIRLVYLNNIKINVGNQSGKHFLTTKVVVCLSAIFFRVLTMYYLSAQ